jgi:hypothetical protein
MIYPKINGVDLSKTLNVIVFVFIFLSTSGNAQIVPPYINGFENTSDTVGWTHFAYSGTDDWEWGIPDDYYFAPAPEGLKAWGTNLDGDYSQNSSRSLITPYFDLSNTSEDYVLAFQNIRQSTGFPTGYYLEYNLNGSSTWQVLYNASADKLNWNTGGSFSLNQYSAMYAKINLSWIQGNDSVRFRFHFSTSSNSGEGWEIDNFQIRPVVNNYKANQGDTVFHVTKNFTEIETKSPVLFTNEFSISMLAINHYYWSTDPILDGGDLFIGSLNLNSSGGNHPMTQTIALPPNLIVGTYYLISQADATNLIAESDETDNQNFTVIILDSLYTTPFITDFEPGNVEWNTPSIGPLNDWTLGQPDQWHVHSARSGSNAWIGPVDSWGTLEQYIETPYLDLTGSTNTSLCLWYYVNSSHSNYLGNVAFVEFPEENLASVTHPEFYPTTSTPDSIEFKNHPIYDWRCTCVDVSSMDNHPSTKFRIYSYNNIPVDDVYIGTSKPDAAIQGHTDNRFTSSSANTDTLWYAYFNSGMEILNPCLTSFYWSTDSLLDGGDVFVGSKLESLMSDTSFMDTYFLYNKVSNAPGIFYLIATIDSNNDIDEMREYDNEKVFKIYQQNTIPLPYSNDFETEITDWRHNASRHEDEWHWGDPEGSQIDSAFSGVKAWYTGTNGFVNDSSRMHLYTPVFNLTQLQNPVLEFDYANALAGTTMIEHGGIMYSIDGGYTWIPVIPQNNSYQRMYNEIDYNWTDGLDEIEALNANSLILFGYNLPWLLYSDMYQGRDYDETTHFSVDLEYLGNSSQIQFMFLYAKNAPSASNGCMVDNFSITESKIDFMIPTEKDIMADADDAQLKFFFSIKNDNNYLSAPSLIYLYCSEDSLIDPTDTLVYQGNINALMPYANQHIIINQPTPSNFGNYNYILYQLDPMNTVAESNETNNLGYFDLAMDTALNYQYPLLFDFEEEYINGWTYYLDSAAGQNGHRFRSQMIIGDIWSVDANSGEWFLDSRWTSSTSVSSKPTHYLEGPAFDFTGHTDIQVSFDFLCIGKNYTTGTGSQGANLQYSTDGGSTWQVATESLDPGAINWYNLNAVMSLNNEPGWGLIDEWTNAQFDFSFLANQPDVRFRFKYKSIFFPSSTDPNGFRLDNFQISADQATYLPLLNICQGDSVFVFGNYETQAGMYLQNLTNGSGSDSIIFQEIIVFDSLQNSVVENLCQHESYTFPDGVTINDLSTDVIHYSMLTSSNGCDSIIQTTLHVTSVNTNVTETSILLTAPSGQDSYQWLDCNNNFAQIPGQTMNWMNMFTPGGYAVMITNNGCVDTSACFGAYVNSIAESDTAAIELYPNPTSGVVHVNLLKTEKEIKLKIYNMQGELILDKIYYDTNDILFELNESNGLYLVEVITGDTIIQSFRLIKL